MLEIEEDVSLSELQEKYKKRVNELLIQIKAWLPENFVVLEEKSQIVEDFTGQYAVNSMRFFIKDVDEPDDFIFHISPVSAKTLLGEGLVKIVGTFSSENLVYFCKDTLLQVEHKPGQFRPIYSGVDTDGWYWLKESLLHRVIKVTQAQFFDLIKAVSYDYDK